VSVAKTGSTSASGTGCVSWVVWVQLFWGGQGLLDSRLKNYQLSSPGVGPGLDLGRGGFAGCGVLLLDSWLAGYQRLALHTKRDWDSSGT
jgi:hypothetical protein